MKETYETLEMEIIVFDAADVINASPGGDDDAIGIDLVDQ